MAQRPQALNLLCIFLGLAIANFGWIVVGPWIGHKPVTVDVALDHCYWQASALVAVWLWHKF